MNLHEFPAKVETPAGTFVSYRLLCERADPGPWKATLYTKDAQQRAELPRVSRVVPLGNRQWLIIGQHEAWRLSRTGGCGCSSSTTGTAPEVVEWLAKVVEQEPWGSE